MTLPGKFITLEGGEGAGKSTQLKLIEQELRAAGVDVLVTREPGGTPRAESIRELLLSRDEEAMPESCELLLMFAARATHLHNLIQPTLRRGAWVVCDRFTDASFAYQGYGRGMPLERISALEDWVQQGLRPDLTLLLDVPVAQALQRAAQRNVAQGAQHDRFEMEQQSFFERVRAGYLQRATAEPARFQIINASRSLEEVSESVRHSIRRYLQQVWHA